MDLAVLTITEALIIFINIFHNFFQRTWICSWWRKFFGSSASSRLARHMVTSYNTNKMPSKMEVHRVSVKAISGIVGKKWEPGNLVPS